MATARLDSRRGGGNTDAVIDLVRRRSGVASPFCVSGRVHFCRSAVGDGSRGSRYSRADARGRSRRRRNSDAPRNSCASSGQLDSREQWAGGRERGVQRHSFFANVAYDRLAVRRTETAFDLAPRRTRRRGGCHRAGY